MDATNTQVMSLRLSIEELQKIDAAAAEAGMSRPDYARTKLLEPVPTASPALEESIRYLIYMVENLHLSTYLIAEKSAFLEPEQLHAILKSATQEAGLYVHQLTRHFAKLRELVEAFQAADEQKQS